MRLRRLELAVLAITLAFAVFMGGFFTGRSTGNVNITASAAQTGETRGAQVQISAQQQAPVPQTPATGSGNGSATAEAPTAPPLAGTDEGNAPQGTGDVKHGDGKININTATAGELTDLPGIGDVIASRIIDYRTQKGAFTKIEDIQNVSGIGESRYGAIKDLITVGTP